MKIALASDHAGFEQLARLKTFLQSHGYECQNFGPDKLNPDDDYPDFVINAALAVGSGECEKGIIIGGSGQGEAMAANRITKVRCAVYYGPAAVLGQVDAEGHKSTDLYDILRLTRQHNDANMLSIGARFVSQSGIEHAVMLWLREPFSDEPRHQRRINKLDWDSPDQDQ